MKSYQKPIKRYFVDLLFTISTGSGFQGINSLTPSLFEDYLKVLGNYDNEKLSMIEKFELITREKFQNDYPSDSWPDIETETDWLCEDFQEIIPENEELVNVELFNDENLNGLYNYYYHKTGALPYEAEKGIIIKCLSDEDFDEIEKILLDLGKKVLERSILIKVEKKLRRCDRYISPGKKTVDKTSEACKEVFYYLMKEYGTVNSELLFKRVKTKYVIKDYSEYSPNVAQKKLKAAVNSWHYRNVKQTKE